MDATLSDYADLVLWLGFAFAIVLTGTVCIVTLHGLWEYRVIEALRRYRRGKLVVLPSEEVDVS